MSSLFLETSPIWISANHIKFLTLCLSYSEDNWSDDAGGILQRDIVRKTGLSKKTVSVIKSDLIKLGWCKDTDLGSGREVRVRLCKQNEVRKFLGRLEFLKHTIPVRPHNISIRCLFVDRLNQEAFERAVCSLTQKYWTQQSWMTNNLQYTVITELGKINFYLKGTDIKFWLDGFILPVAKGDVPLLEEYIGSAINERVFALHSLLKEHFKPFRVKIADCVVLDKLDAGILTKKNASRTLSLLGELPDFGLYPDSSIYGCDEFEVRGTLDSVVAQVKDGLQLMFDKEASDEHR